MNTTEIKKLFEKERLEKDVLNRIRWDKQLDKKDFSVGYLERFSGNLVYVPYNSITIDGDFFHSGDSLIPMHRIREIRYGGEVVWAKRKAD